MSHFPETSAIHVGDWSSQYISITHLCFTQAGRLPPRVRVPICACSVFVDGLLGCHNVVRAVLSQSSGWTSGYRLRVGLLFSASRHSVHGLDRLLAGTVWVHVCACRVYIGVVPVLGAVWVSGESGER